MENREIKFHIGQLVKVTENIEAQSEHWGKEHWVIPKGHFSIVRDVDKENGLCLIEYADSTFYVDEEYLTESTLKTNTH